MGITYNHDIAGIVRRMRRFKYEWAKAASGQASFVSNADGERLQSYLDSIRSFKKWCQSEPDLDLPESSPKTHDLGEAEVVPLPDNEAVVDVMNLWDLMVHELMHSQSSRMPARLIEHDERRLDALLDKTERFLKDYISNILPLDLPESSPLRGSTGLGRTGV